MLISKNLNIIGTISIIFLLKFLFLYNLNLTTTYANIYMQLLQWKSIFLLKTTYLYLGYCTYGVWDGESNLNWRLAQGQLHF